MGAMGQDVILQQNNPTEIFNNLGMNINQVPQINPIPILAHMANEHMIHQLDQVQLDQAQNEQEQGKATWDLDRPIKITEEHQREALKNEMIAHL